MQLRPALSALEREQACDLRRSVLCGELHMGREAARDAEDDTAYLALVWDGEKPVGTGRLLAQGGLHQLQHLCVLPQYRRRGLGRLLVAHFEGVGREAGAAELVAVAPQGAQAFFVAAGFIVEKEDGEVALLRRQL